MNFGFYSKCFARRQGDPELKQKSAYSLIRYSGFQVISMH
jgi:hypothetical protein